MEEVEARLRWLPDVVVTKEAALRCRGQPVSTHHHHHSNTRLNLDLDLDIDKRTGGV